ncbi:MAG: anhydro-N-acetylmuramic acid kinase, partial [Nocardioidaceae bacterium]|nr:anhydro-N-acetylmuramic acid kinase [Nocardioidaceae bacterium]
MIIVAVASGTSADGLDVGVVDIDWAGAEPNLEPDIELRLLHMRTDPWPAGLGEAVLELLPPAVTTAARICDLDTAIGQAVGAAARRAMHESDADVELVVSPGQTVHHEVRDGECLGTLQIGQPAWVVEATGLPVVSDLRARDVSAGGHGAPLTSTLDALWLAAAGGPTAALNLGGIANVTVVGAAGEPVTAWDTGPANCLIDIAAAHATGGAMRCDLDGAMATRGVVRSDLLDRLLAHPYFALTPPVSTGREVFSAQLLDEALAQTAPIEPDDIVATLTELTAVTVARALRPYEVVEVVASGGGTRNPTLMAALRRALGPTRLTTSDRRGIPAEAKEVVMWALLGFLSWHGVAATTQATGARNSRVLGRISPGDA